MCVVFKLMTSAILPSSCQVASQSLESPRGSGKVGASGVEQRVSWNFMSGYLMILCLSHVYKFIISLYIVICI